MLKAQWNVFSKLCEKTDTYQAVILLNAVFDLLIGIPTIIKTKLNGF